MRSQSPPRLTQRTPVSATHAAIASRSVSPYMWSTSGPTSTVPECGEGIEATTAPDSDRMPGRPLARAGCAAPDPEGNRARAARLRHEDPRHVAPQVDQLRAARTRLARALPLATARCAPSRWDLPR